MFENYFLNQLSRLLKSMFATAEAEENRVKNQFLNSAFLLARREVASPRGFEPLLPPWKGGVLGL